MEVKPGFKKSELGSIPEDWVETNIEALEPFVTSGSRGWARFYSKTGDLFVRITNMSRESIYLDLTEPRFVRLPPSDHEGRRTQLRRGDFLISVTADIGIVSYVDARVPTPAYINQHIALVRLDSCAANPRFISYLLSHARSQRRFRAITDQGAKAGINLATVKGTCLTLPPPAEQEAIAEALRDADALIESLEQLIAKKRHFKQGAMQELLTGKKRLPGFTGKWTNKTFGEIFDFHSTATNSRSDLNPEGDTYYIHYGDIHTRFHSHLDFSHERPPKIDRRHCKNATLLKNGDWIMVDASEDFDGIAKSVEVSSLNEGMAAVAGLHTFLLRERTATFAPGFKGHLRNLHSLHQQLLRVATGMKVFGVSKTALKNLFLCVPNPDEQSAIAAILSDMDAEIAAPETKLAKARRLKQGMMHNLLTGAIRLVDSGQLEMDNGRGSNG